MYNILHFVLLLLLVLVIFGALDRFDVRGLRNINDGGLVFEKIDDNRKWGLYSFLRCWNKIDLRISLALPALLPSAFFSLFYFIFLAKKGGGAGPPGLSLRSATVYLSSRTKQPLYYSVIYPYITYCNSTLSSTYVSNLNGIFYSQKRAVRAITNSDYRQHSAPSLAKLGIMDIFQINSF